MRTSMKMLTVSFIAVSLASFATDAEATQRCYRLSPFVDILKLEFEPIASGHQEVHGNWIAPNYTLPASGAFELNKGSTTVKRLGIVGTNNSASFGDNLICGLDGIRNGAFEINCSGGREPISRIVEAP